MDMFPHMIKEYKRINAYMAYMFTFPYLAYRPTYRREQTELVLFLILNFAGSTIRNSWADVDESNVVC